jgi:hypothetical protein
MSEGLFDYRAQLELEALEKKLDAAAEANPLDAVLLVVDRRAGRAGYVIALISPASAWHALLPRKQIAEIREREPAYRI